MKRTARAGKYLLRLVGTSAVLTLASCGGNSTNTSAPEGNTSTAGADISASAEKSSESSSSMDACALLAKADATRLFGMDASSREPEIAPLPDQVGVCQWGWVGAEKTQQVSLKVFTDPEDHFSMLSGAQPLDLGNKGELIADETTGTTAVNWVQDGWFFNLDYQSNSFENSKVDQLKALAKQISGRIQG